jgi:hypothetical protein
MWKHAYDSPWHNPTLFIVVNVTLLLLALQSTFALRSYILIFCAEILLDATLTNDFSPLPRESLGYVAIPFVILGDARALVLMERLRATPSSRAWLDTDPRKPTLIALALAFVVPVIAQVLRLVAPTLAGGRLLFLSYECVALVAWSVYFAARIRPALASAEPAFARWGSRLFLFVLAQYALWALADVLIITGLDAGFGLRLLPNIMYYALFLGFAWRTAPEGVR